MDTPCCKGGRKMSPGFCHSGREVIRRMGRSQRRSLMACGCGGLAWRKPGEEKVGKERERGQGVRRAWQDPRLPFPLPEVGATTLKIRFHDLIHTASN